MRFISPVSGYRLIAVHEQTTVLADGTRKVDAPGYTVEFQKGAATDYEKEIARERLHFRGVPMNYDRTPFDPIKRVSVFDTEWIGSPELRKKVEKALLENADRGKQDGYILVDTPKRPAPWPAYDELTVHGQRKAANVAAQNIETANATGTPIGYLIAYEKENRNDARIIEAYEKALAEVEAAQPEEELVEA